ncbi:MAG: response regulator transcription factor [Bacteroidota bacterium]
MEKKLIGVSIVEDNPKMRALLIRLVTITPSLKYISEYTCAEDALIGLSKDLPDMVIMDIDFNTTMTGVECMFRLKLKHPKMNFLMFTVFEESEKLFDALKYGADGYIVKGGNITKVVDAIHEIHDGGAPMSQAIAKKVLESFSVVHRNKEVLASLTPRQIEILELLTTGKQYKEIAAELNPPISTDGLRVQISRIYKKLQVNNRTEAINLYLGRS